MTTGPIAMEKEMHGERLRDLIAMRLRVTIDLTVTTVQAATRQRAKLDQTAITRPHVTIAPAVTLQRAKADQTAMRRQRETIVPDVKLRLAAIRQREKADLTVIRRQHATIVLDEILQLAAIRQPEKADLTVIRRQHATIVLDEILRLAAIRQREKADRTLIRRLNVTIGLDVIRQRPETIDRVAILRLVATERIVPSLLRQGQGMTDLGVLIGQDGIRPVVETMARVEPPLHGDPRW